MLIHLNPAIHEQLSMLHHTLLPPQHHTVSTTPRCVIWSTASVCHHCPPAVCPLSDHWLSFIIHSTRGVGASAVCAFYIHWPHPYSVTRCPHALTCPSTTSGDLAIKTPGRISPRLGDYKCFWKVHAYHVCMYQNLDFISFIHSQEEHHLLYNGTICSTFRWETEEGRQQQWLRSFCCEI